MLPKFIRLASRSWYVQAITYNKQLREQIDNLRRERLMFEAINSNLDKELARIKRNIAGAPADKSSSAVSRHTLSQIISMHTYA
jgi:hypothetical protein